MRVFWLTLALCASLFAGPEACRARRAELRKAIGGGVLVLFGRTEKQQGVQGFEQEPNFYYLTGWSEPGAALILDGEADILLIPRRDPEQEKWTGRKADPADPGLPGATGFGSVLPVETLETQVRSRLERYPALYTLGGEDERKLAALAPLRELRNAAPAIARLRMKKSPGELDLIRKSIEVTVEAHREAWKRAAPGLYEYQIAASMASVYLDRGCVPAYTPIVGSAGNAAILHYSRNSRRVDRQELVVIDVGAACSGYAADITRTIPIAGRFTPRQREIYEIVLGAQKAVLAAIKPGMTLGKNSPPATSLYKIAYDYIDSHGKDRAGNGLGKYFTHGLGHHVGLEVHDASDPNAPLEAGMVVTVEPGVYIPEENLGVRIEDMVLVTETGSQLLTGSLPKEAGEVERALAR
ncbi:MAG: aminopeptidase P family protein [Bryobacterales bacterium]|nr:aminopeptidase P family protein [Bryobacterales bacterium]